jgi:hypothetical protein
MSAWRVCPCRFTPDRSAWRVFCKKTRHGRSGSFLFKVSLSLWACFEALQTFPGSMTDRSENPS